MADQSQNVPTTPPDPQPDAKKGRSVAFWAMVVPAGLVIVFLLALIIAVVVAVAIDSHAAANWISIFRDLFIIVLAMEGMIMGVALIVLVVQLSALINLLQNEIKPIVDNANETVTTVRGTAQFMSENVVEPVVKFGALAAGIGGILREVLAIRRTVRKAGKDGGG
ncbi:MAG: hypothetical protein HY866_18285 [Chloroflexi bacterium]|nr:hypothetical protein [Chloroflexota bacterium]